MKYNLKQIFCKSNTIPIYRKVYIKKEIKNIDCIGFTSIRDLFKITVHNSC